MGRRMEGRSQTVSRRNGPHRRPCDSAGIYQGSKLHHAAPFREAVLAGVLDPIRTIRIGIRGVAE